MLPSQPSGSRTFRIKIAKSVLRLGRGRLSHPVGDSLRKPSGCYYRAKTGDLSVTLSMTIVYIRNNFGDTSGLDAEIFRLNLRVVLRVNALKQREFADTTGASYPSISKVCSHRLTRVEA